MISQVIYLNHQRHYSTRDVIHTACKSYMHIFNFQAQTDNDDDSVSDDDYNVAKWVKQLDNMYKQNKSLVKNPKRIMTSFCVLSFYLGTINQDLECNISDYKKRGIAIHNSSDIVFALGPNILYTKRACIKAMDTVCKLVYHQNSKTNLKVTSETISSCHLSAELKNMLHRTLTGGK